MSTCQVCGAPRWAEHEEPDCVVEGGEEWFDDDLDDLDPDEQIWQVI